MGASWPSDWAERRRGKGCPMCGQERADENEYGVRVLAGRFSDAYLQRTSWQRGYTVVVWRGRHVAEPTEPDAERRPATAGGPAVGSAPGEALPRSSELPLRGTSCPPHTHLVRVADDPAPGGPLPFPEGERPGLPEDLLRRDALALRSLL